MYDVLFHSRIPVINEETARKALLEEVGHHCCWGKGPAEDLSFLDLKSFSAMHVSSRFCNLNYVSLSQCPQIIEVATLCFFKDKLFKGN